MPIASSDVDRLDSSRFDRLSKDFFEWSGLGLYPFMRQERRATKTAAVCFPGGSDQRLQVWRRRRIDQGGG